MKLNTEVTIKLLDNNTFFDAIVTMYNVNPINSLKAENDRYQGSANCTVYIETPDEPVMVVVYQEDNEIMMQAFQDGEYISKPFTLDTDLANLESHRLCQLFSDFLVETIKKLS